jgi:GAF domain
VSALAGDAEGASTTDLRPRSRRGTLGWIFSRAVPLLDESGEIVEWFGTASDVTARKQAESKFQAQLARLALLSQITRAVGERQDIKSIFQVVIRTLEEHLPVDFCSICLYEPEAKELTVTSVGKHSEPLAIELAMTEHAHIPIVLSQCVQGQLVYEPNLNEVPFPFPQRLLRGGLGAFVVAPLLVESEVFGVLVAARRESDSFSSGECEFLRQLSEHVALATHQAKLHNVLQRAYDDLRQTQQAVMQQERLLALGKMASGTAHDINNAISPVALYTESLLEHASELSPRPPRKAKDFFPGCPSRSLLTFSNSAARCMQALSVSRSLSKVVIAAARSWTSVSLLEHGNDLSGDETAQATG